MHFFLFYRSQNHIDQWNLNIKIPSCILYTDPEMKTNFTELISAWHGINIKACGDENLVNTSFPNTFKAALYH